MEARCIADCGCGLGEGILWDPSRQRLFWFDIPRMQICSCGADGGDFQRVNLPGRISAAAPEKNGGFAVAAGNGFGIFSPEKNRFLQWREAEQNTPSIRTNDGRADPHGAFWFGTMEKTETLPVGAIYRVSPDGQIQRKMEGVTIPNAIAFSPAGDIMYWTDSPKRIIWQCDLSADGGTANPRVFAALENGPQVPDGAVTDAEGFLWNAEWDGWRVVRYAPDGRIDRVVEMPVSRPTCPAFGGPDFSFLYVSSAREGLDAAELKRQPQAGGVFAFAAPYGCPPSVFG